MWNVFVCFFIYFFGRSSIDGANSNVFFPFKLVLIDHIWDMAQMYFCRRDVEPLHEYSNILLSIEAKALPMQSDACTHSVSYYVVYC